MRTIVIKLLILVVLTTPIVSIHAGDQEWRAFGETAAVLLGIRALTGWDPIGEILDYPRHHAYHSQPTGAYGNVITYEPPQEYPEYRCTKISAYPCQHPWHSEHIYQPSTTVPAYRNDINQPPPMGSYYSPADNNSQPVGQPAIAPPAIRPPNQEEAKAPIEISRRSEGDNEIITRKIWIEPHWEKTMIDSHWRGDIWVESHWENKWVEGKWELVEERKLKSTEDLKPTH